MTVTIGGVIVAEGSEEDCAAYTFRIMEMMRLMHEKMQEKKDTEWMEKFGDLSWEEIVRRECEDE